METTEEIVGLEARYRRLLGDPRRSLAEFVDASVEYGRLLSEVDLQRAHDVLSLALETLHDPPAPAETEVALRVMGLLEVVAGRIGNVSSQLAVLERQRRVVAGGQGPAGLDGAIDLRRRSSAALLAAGRVAEGLDELTVGLEEAADGGDLEVFGRTVTDLVAALRAHPLPDAAVPELDRVLARTRHQRAEAVWVVWCLVGMGAVRLAADDVAAARLYVRRLRTLAATQVLPAVAGVVMAEVALAEDRPDVAVELGEELVEVGSPDIRVRFLSLAALGRALVSAGRDDEAVRTLAEASGYDVGDDRTLAAVHDALAALAERGGRFEDAYRHLRTAERLARRSAPSAVALTPVVDIRSPGRRLAPVANPEEELALRIVALQQLVEERTRELEQAQLDLIEMGERSALDGLTGLLGRDRLRSMLAATLATRTDVSVLSIDVDRFGRVNETLGHEVGDALLTEIAQRLRTALADADLVARWGGDEFVAVIVGVREPTAAQAVAEAVRQCLAQPWTAAGGVELVPSVSIGVAIADGARDADLLLRQADTAMVRAKLIGKDRVLLYHSEISGEARRRLDIETMVRQALERDWFELHFQPICSNVTGRPYAAEALLRIRHPELGLVTPVSFLDVVEETGLTGPVGRWVIDTACAALSRWSRVVPDFTIAVNVSPTLLDMDLPTVVAEALERCGAEAAQLVVEVTEHTLLDADDVQVTSLVALRELGVKIALDDFGTSYSSLHHLRRFPVDIVKIDRSFVAGICDHPQDEAIVQAIVDLSRVFGFRVIAEGVETVEQLELQRRLGCHGAQGYLLGRPVPADDLAPVLAHLGVDTAPG